MGNIGRTAKVISAGGKWSRQYIGQTGIVVKQLTSAGKVLLVLQFSSGLPNSDQGLYDGAELEWLCRNENEQGGT